MGAASPPPTSGSRPPDAVTRFAGALLSRLRSQSRLRPRPKDASDLPRAARGVSLSGEPLTGSSHAVTSVHPASREAAGGSAMTRVAGVGLTPWHLSPFLRVAHAGPARSRGNPEPTSPRAGLASLVYVLTGAARVQAGAGTATRLRANDALLLDAGSGALVSVCPEAGPVELLRVWIDVPAGARDMRPRMALSRALPLYVAVDSASGAERARVRVVLGDSAPLRGGKPARAEARPLNALVAAGVFDVKISAGMSARIRLNSVRALVYVREGTANIGGRPVKKGSLAVLHGPPAGGVVIDADGDESCAVVIMQGEAMPGKVVLDAQGIAANTPRELRKRVKRYARGDMADVFVDEG